MDRERQTLELLQLLGDEVAEAVMERLQPEQAEKLRARLIADSPHISTISRQREVLDEFECFFQFALRTKPSETQQPSASNENALGESSGADDETANAGDASAADASLTQDSKSHSATDSKSENDSEDSVSGDKDEQGDTESESSDESEETNSELEESMTATIPISITMTNDPLQDLQKLSIHQIALALGSEQPRTTAILLSNLPAKLTGEVLNLLKPEYQKLVMQELTKEQHAPAVLIERIARATFIRAQQLPADPPDSRDHADRVAEVLRSVPKAGRRNMLAAIEEQDPDLAKLLLTRIYRFEDITGLTKAVVQRVMGEVDSTNLTTALLGTSEEIREAIYANLSKRARQTIEEEMQFMTNVPEDRIKQARESIAEVIAKIDMESDS